MGEGLGVTRQGETAKRLVCCAVFRGPATSAGKFEAILLPQSQERWLMRHIPKVEGHRGWILATFLA